MHGSTIWELFFDVDIISALELLGHFFDTVAIALLKSANVKKYD